jgi:hypothetical protein
MAINFPNNPTNGQIYSEGNKSWQWLGNRWGTYNIQNPFLIGFRNKIINSNFNFWQRGTSLASGTGSRFLADRFRNASIGSTYSTSRQSFSLGQTDVPNNPKYFHRTVVSSIAGNDNYVLLTQSIENVTTFAGETVTLSFYAKADSNKPISVEFIQFFGSGGSPSDTVRQSSPQKLNLTTSWQKFIITVDIPSVLGKTLGTDGNDDFRIHFWFEAGSNLGSRTNFIGQQSGTFDIAQVQLEAGPVATPFENLPTTIELSLCQRYYCKSFNIDQTPASGIYDGSLWAHEPVGENGTIHNTVSLFPVPMVKTPTLVFYHPTLVTSVNRIYMSATTTPAAETAAIGSYNVCPTKISNITTSFSYSSTEPTGGLRSAGWQYTADAEI